MALINIYYKNDEQNLELIIKQNKQIMAKLQEVQDQVVALQVSVDETQAALAKALETQTTLLATQAQAIVDLEAQLVVSANPEQLQAVIDSLKAVQADVLSTPTGEVTPIA